MDDQLTPPNDRPRSVASGHLDIADQRVECHVLSDERRVLDTSQIQALLGAAKERHFRRMLERIPSLSEEIQARPSIEFTRPDGRTVAYGYEAAVVTDVCLAYQRAFLDGTLHHKQVPIARRAMAIVAASAKVGLEALIDEATGYKGAPGDYLRKRFAEFLRDRHDDWKARWTEDVLSALCRLYGKRYEPGMPPPRCLWRAEGMIYDLLMGDDVMAEVRQRNPDPQRGSNHHQLFRDAVQRLLESDLRVILALARTADSKMEFWHHMHVHYRGVPLQMRLT